MDRGTLANAIGLSANLGLGIAKFIIGAAAGSEALIADGFNSAGDVLATAIAWAGYRLGQEPPDDEHPYGHGNFESAAGLIVGAILLATGVFICVDGVRALAAGVEAPPEPLALYAIAGTALVKELLYRYVEGVGRDLNSPTLLASARDHRADVVIAIAVFGGVLAARMGWPWLDPLTAVGVGLYVAWMAWEPIRTNLGVLLDEAPPEIAAAVRAAALDEPAVQQVDRVSVHPLGSYYVIQAEIGLDGALRLDEAHAIAHRVEDRVRASVEHVREVHVHVNPAGTKPDNLGGVDFGP